jgi:hypothetical protein
MIAFRTYILEKKSECDFISYRQLKSIESVLDKKFKKYEINFDFTKHFADRMGDDRNDPCISMKELGQLFTKIYRNEGKKLKTAKDFEAVLKDFSTDINVPIAVEYDSRKDEFRIGLKTIMRKKNFKTPDKTIGYK